MRQVAQVIRKMDRGFVEVRVHRTSACSAAHNCGSCDSCAMMANAPEILVLARDELGAAAGDQVVVESETSRVLGAAAVLYLVPFLLFFLGYFLGQGAQWQESASIALGGGGFLAGLLLAKGLDLYLKKRRPVQYRVAEIVG